MSENGAADPHLPDDRSNSLDPSLDISTDLRKFDPVDVCLEQRPAHDAISKCDVSKHFSHTKNIKTRHRPQGFPLSHMVIFIPLQSPSRHTHKWSFHMHRYFILHKKSLYDVFLFISNILVPCPWPVDIYALSTIDHGTGDAKLLSRLIILGMSELKSVKDNLLRKPL